MAKLKNKEQTINAISKAVKKGIKKSMPHIKQQLRAFLMANQTADGKAQPTKKPSTIKQYEEHGWDTQHWLVRTGDSTKLEVTYADGSVKITPANPEILQFVQGSSDWFQLNEDMQQHVTDNISKEIYKIGRS